MLGAVAFVTTLWLVRVTAGSSVANVACNVSVAAIASSVVAEKRIQQLVE